jgi:hypothetical protein
LPQKQLQALQTQVTETKQQAKAAQQSAQTAQQSAQTAQQSAETAQQTVQNVPKGLYAADLGLPTKAAAPSWFGGIHVSMAGSFIAMECVWRERNEISSGASDPPFSSLPFEDRKLIATLLSRAIDPRPKCDTRGRPFGQQKEL